MSSDSAVGAAPSTATEVVMPVFGPGFVVDKSAPAGAPVSRARAVRYLLIAAVVVVLVVLTARLYWRPSGWVFYSREGCGWCIKQEGLLPPNFKAIVKTNRKGVQIGGMARPPIPVNSPLIKGYPFWYNARTREHKAGMQDAASLAKMGIR